jgi:hypothetical protein
LTGPLPEVCAGHIPARAKDAEARLLGRFAGELEHGELLRRQKRAQDDAAATRLVAVDVRVLTDAVVARVAPRHHRRAAIGKCESVALAQQLGFVLGREDRDVIGKLEARLEALLARRLAVSRQILLGQGAPQGAAPLKPPKACGLKPLVDIHTGFKGRSPLRGSRGGAP